MNLPAGSARGSGPRNSGGAAGAGIRGDEIAGLVRMVRDWGEETRPDAEERLARLADAIARWNEAINLVSRRDVGRLVKYHFCDAVSVLPLLGLRGRMEILDVGGSNGLPGLALAAVSPYAAVTVCDSRSKRRGFLEEVCGSGVETAGMVPGAGLGGFELGRVDSLDFRRRHAGGFDLVLARAVTRLKPLVRWCMPLVRPGGRLVAYKGSRAGEEVGEAEPHFFGHGGGMLALVGSPAVAHCNPLRIFAIALRGV